jgi:ubiquinone/menaquinone biosynthesis C-methylase UbiE
MNRWIEPGTHGLEVGSGAGFSKLFISSANLMLTDVEPHPWIDQQVDGLAMPFPDSSFDFIVSSNMIHHVATPHRFFAECARVLRPNGRLIIQEINTSLAMRAILRIMHHEGYSYDVSVFEPDTICNDPRDPWSANCALPHMLFGDPRRFAETFPFRMLLRQNTEFLIFPLSGGVIAKTKTINLPPSILRLVDAIDNLLVAIAPDVFSLQMNVVLEVTK